MPARPARPRCGRASASPGPRLHAGTPSAAKRATSVQPELGRDREAVPSIERARGSGCRGRARPPARCRRRRTSSPSLRAPARGAPAPSASASASVRSGAKRWLRVTVATSGTTLPATPPSTAHRLERLAVLAPVDHRPPLLEALDEAQERAQAVDGVAPHPGPGGVGPAPRSGHLQPQRALAAGLDLAAGGLAEDGDVAGQQVGPVADEVAEAVVLGRRPPRRRRTRRSRRRRARARPRPARASPPARPSCRRPEPPQHVAVDRGPARCRSPARCRCGRRGPPARRAERGCGRPGWRRPARPRGAGRRRSRASRWSVSAASAWLTDGIATSVGGQRPAGRVGHGPAPGTTLRGTVSRRDRHRSHHRRRRGAGLATLSDDGRVLDTWYLAPERDDGSRHAGTETPGRAASEDATGPAVAAGWWAATRCATWPCRACHARSPTCRPHPSTPTTSTSASTSLPPARAPEHDQPRGHLRATGHGGVDPARPRRRRGPAGRQLRARAAGTPARRALARQVPPDARLRRRRRACGSPTPAGCASAPTWPRAPPSCTRAS